MIIIATSGCIQQTQPYPPPILISLVDIYCPSGELNVIIRNEGRDVITVSSLKFYINGEETIPTCGGNSNPRLVTINPGDTMGCSLGYGLSGTVSVRIVGPSNAVEGIVDCNPLVSGTEQACINSGGTVGTSLCCKSTGDFPNNCLIGACGCAPTYSHEVKVCNCPTGKCFDGSKCV